MEVRRRLIPGSAKQGLDEDKADPICQPPPSVEDVSDEEESEKVNELVTMGLNLYNEAENSDFQKLDPLVQGLMYFVEAAEKGSRSAVEHLKSFFVETPSKAKALMEDLPKELIGLAYTLIEGTPTELKICRIAKEMFETMSEGSKIIRKEDINLSVQRLLDAKFDIEGAGSINSVEKLLRCAATTDDNGDKIVTEEAFCLIATRYARGEVVLSPLDNEVTELSPEQLVEFKKSNIIKKVTDFPKETLNYFSTYVLRIIERHGVRWIWSMFSMRQLYFVLLVYLLPLINVEIVLTTLATLAFTGSLLAMVISTLQIVANSAKVSSFMEYSSIFTHFSSHSSPIDTTESEFKVIKRLALPYLTFVISILLAIFTIKQSHSQLIIYELLVLASGAMAFVVFFHFQCWKSPLLLLTIFTRLLSWSLVFLHILQTWLPIPDILFFSGWQILSIPVFPGINLDINLITLVQSPLQIAIVVYYVYKYSWKNFFQGFGPYLLFLSWWIFCRYLFGESSIFSLVIFVPGVLSILLFLPLLPLMIFMSPFIVMFYYGMIQFLILLALFLVFGSIALVATFNYQRLKEAKWLNIPLDYLVLINLVIIVLALIAGTMYYNHQHIPGPLPLVGFDKYYSLCGPDNVRGHNYIETQLNCLHLKDRLLSVETGVIEKVKIKEVLNEQLNSLSVFPASIQSAFKCLMGERKSFCGDLIDEGTCVFKGCNFDYRNSYLVEVLVALAEGQINGQLMLYVSHRELTNKSSLVRKLHSNMQISFNATLVDGLGSDLLVLDLKSLVLPDGTVYNIISTVSTKGNIEAAKDQLLTRAWKSFKSTVSFVFEIMCGLTPSGYYM